MGWWTASDGIGVIGDRPADILGTLLSESLGDRFDTDHLGGFLVAIATALLRNPTALVADLSSSETWIVVEFADSPTLRIPITRGALLTGLDGAVYDALEATAFQYLVSDLARRPTLAELLDTIAFVSRGHVTDVQGRPIALDRIRPSELGHPAGSPPYGWLAMRGLLADVGLAGSAVEVQELVDANLGDHDWRARMTAVLVVGRFRLEPLARRARAACVPPPDVGLRDDDRRSLLALRDVAADRAQGAVPERPVHPDAGIAAAREALVDDVRSAVGGSALPGPKSRAHILKALVEPAAVIAEETAPSQWHGWLTTES